MEKSLQQLANEQCLIAVDNISFGRVVMTFEDGSEVIMQRNDREFIDCKFRLLEEAPDNTMPPTGRLNG